MQGELGTRTANSKTGLIEYCLANECRLTAGVLDPKSPKQTHWEWSSEDAIFSAWNYLSTQAFTVLPGTHLITPGSRECMCEQSALPRSTLLKHIQHSQGLNSQSLTCTSRTLPLSHDALPYIPHIICPKGTYPKSIQLSGHTIWHNLQRTWCKHQTKSLYATLSGFTEKPTD